MNDNEATTKLISMLTNVIKVYQTKMIDNCDMMMQIHGLVNEGPAEDSIKRMLMISIQENRDILDSTIKQMQFFEGTLIKGARH